MGAVTASLWQQPGDGDVGRLLAQLAAERHELLDALGVLLAVGLAAVSLPRALLALPLAAGQRRRRRAGSTG
jgi:hypothetical protein